MALRVEDADANIAGWNRFQIVVQVRAIGRVEAVGGIIGTSQFRRESAETVSRPRREEERTGVGDLRRHLTERRDVIEDPKSPAVSGQHKIVKMLLHGNAVHRHMRQIVLEALPMLAIVEGDVQSIFGAEIKQSAARGIFLNAMGVAESGFWNGRT